MVLAHCRCALGAGAQEAATRTVRVAGGRVVAPEKARFKNMRRSGTRELSHDGHTYMHVAHMHMRLFTLTASAAATSYACSFAATAASACATAPFSA